MIIYNDANSKEYATQKIAKDYLEQKLSSVESLLFTQNRKKGEVGIENKLNNTKFKINDEKISNHVQRT